MVLQLSSESEKQNVKNLKWGQKISITVLRWVGLRIEIREGEGDQIVRPPSQRPSSRAKGGSQNPGGRGARKGQRKPKADWCAVDSPKKRTKEFVLFAFSLFLANKTNSFIRFLGESTARQNGIWFYKTILPPWDRVDWTTIPGSDRPVKWKKKCGKL